jgi:hypothetical protein
LTATAPLRLEAPSLAFEAGADLACPSPHVAARADEQLGRVDEALAKAQIQGLFADAVSTLPERQKLAFALSAYERLSDNEIAVVLETTPDTVRGLLDRALATLETQAARQWLAVLVDMYAGMDAGPTDPVHAVREKARALIDGTPSRQDPFTIAQQMAAALPGDHRATTLADNWRATLERIEGS